MATFYIFEIKGSPESDYIEAIRFLANPGEKHRAHVTIRGPYKQRIDIAPINKRFVDGALVVGDPGNFFDHDQNTVFFRCESADLVRIWKKRDFPFNPHLTLYDGPSHDFAVRLFEVVSRYAYTLRFCADQLVPLVSYKGQANMDLRLSFNSELVSAVLKRRLKADDVAALPETSRLSMIARLCQRLSQMSLPWGNDADRPHALAKASRRTQ